MRIAALHDTLATTHARIHRYFQRVSGLTTSSCKLCGIFVPEGSRAHHLKSKHPEVTTAIGFSVGEQGIPAPAPASKFGHTDTSHRVAHLSADVVGLLSAIVQE